MVAPTILVSAEENLEDPIDIRVDIIHPEPVTAVAFPAAAIVRTQAQHEEAIRGILEHLQGVPIEEEMSTLRFRMGMVEAENASLRGKIKTMEAIEAVTRSQEKRARMEMERQLALVQESRRQDRENFRKLQELVTRKENVVTDALSRKEQIKPLRVRALVITIGLDLPKQILNAQTGAQKPKNLKHEYVEGVIRKDIPKEKLKIEVHNTFHVSNLKKCYADEPLAVPSDGLHINDKLYFVEEPVEIMDREVKWLKQSRIPIVKVRWDSRRGPESTCECEDQFGKKYPHLFTKTAPSLSDIPSKISLNLTHLTLMGLSFNNFNGTLPSWLFTSPSLEYHFLEYNMFIGNVPFALPSLKMLDLSNNQLSELELDTLLSSLTYLEYLELSYSGFSVKTNNANHYVNHGFWFLNLASCKLKVFPESFRAMKQLRLLDLSGNEILGKIPHWAGVRICY
ncbi:putative reverse transcriptase domain-containing protein [Tanacetum coccineum]